MEADPDDTSYWDQPPPAPTFMPVEPKKKKKGKKPPRFRTTTVPPSADFTVCAIHVIISIDCTHTHTHNRLTAFCPGLPG